MSDSISNYYQPENEIWILDTVLFDMNPVESADLIFIVTPEYIAGVPVIIKNALEWLVSTSESHNKLFSYIVISPRGDDAYEALRKHIEIIDGVIKDNCFLLINGGQRIQNKDGLFIDESINVKVNDLISSINHL